MTDELHPKYPHLENLDRVPDVLAAPWLHISEKIHGFNARLGREVDGTPWLGTRNQDIDTAKDPTQGFTQWALSRIDRVPAGVTVYGEWAGKGIQKGIDYGDKAFYLFAVREGADLVDPRELPKYAALMDMRTAPVLYEGANPGIDALEALRRGPSIIAPQPREGIVIVPWPSLFDVYGHQVIAKFKAPEFAERAHARREQPSPADLATVNGFVADYATDERLSHVLDQLTEQGLDGLDRRNMGELLRAMYQDVVREGRADFDALTETDQKLVGKALNGATKQLLDVRIAEALRGAA